LPTIPPPFEAEGNPWIRRSGRCSNRPRSRRSRRSRHFDSTAANVIESAAHKAQRAGVRFIISGASAQIRRTLINHGVKRPLVTYAASIRDAGTAGGLVAVSYRLSDLGPLTNGLPLT
jgi:hypothetical protein